MMKILLKAQKLFSNTRNKTLNNPHKLQILVHRVTLHTVNNQNSTPAEVDHR